MGNFIEDKNWSGSNESLSEFMVKTTTAAKIMDKGKEFYNKSMKDLLEKNNVQLYSTENKEKSSIVERWNRTIKRNMWKVSPRICKSTIDLSTRVRHSV